LYIRVKESYNIAMKKPLFFLCSLIAALAIFWQLSSTSEREPEEESKIDISLEEDAELIKEKSPQIEERVEEVEVEKVGTQIKNETSPTKALKSVPMEKLMSPQAMKTRGEMEELKEQWREKLDHFLNEELQLSPETIQRYKDIEAEFNKEIAAQVGETLKKFQQNLKEGKGQLIEPEDLPFEDTRKKYLEELEHTIGPNNYDLWKEMKERFNKEHKLHGKGQRNQIVF